jgi:hypothetical protein
MQLSNYSLMDNVVQERTIADIQQSDGQEIISKDS